MLSLTQEVQKSCRKEQQNTNSVARLNLRLSKDSPATIYPGQQRKIQQFQLILSLKCRQRNRQYWQVGVVIFSVSLKQILLLQILNILSIFLFAV